MRTMQDSFLFEERQTPRCIVARTVLRSYVPNIMLRFHFAVRREPRVRDDD